MTNAERYKEIASCILTGVILFGMTTMVWVSLPDPSHYAIAVVGR